MQIFDDIPREKVNFYSAEMLAVYESQPDKYAVETDYFSGTIKTADRYYEEIAEDTRKNIVSIRFGFRTKVSGDLALAVWMPDLQNTEHEYTKWHGFLAQPDTLTKRPDARFDMWVQRYLNGSWGVENGAIARMREQVRKLNSLTVSAVRKPLFKSSDLPGVCFPIAQNNHQYHDAHSELYKALIDGLNTDAMKALGAKLAVTLKDADNRKSLKLLKELFPNTSLNGLDVIFGNRRLAAHGERPAAQGMEAFERFNADLNGVIEALRGIASDLQARLKP